MSSGRAFRGFLGDLILGRRGRQAQLPCGSFDRRLTPHECRHSFAAMMIAAGVNAKALQAFMGHASITVTLDTYGHLMPGSEAEAAALVDSYLSAERDRVEDAVRGADRGLTGVTTGVRDPLGR